ncbi:hypothetical protein D3C75_556130 [compost metagenome]
MSKEIIELHQASYNIHRWRPAIYQEGLQAGEEIFQLMTNLLPASLLPVVTELLKEIEWRIKYMTDQVLGRMVHPVAVPVFLQHILKPLQTDNV